MIDELDLPAVAVLMLVGAIFLTLGGWWWLVEAWYRWGDVGVYAIGVCAAVPLGLLALGRSHP